MTDKEEKNACIWHNLHLEHVKKLIKSIGDKKGYPPPKEDMGNPAVWKPEYWKWFKTPSQ